MVDVGFIPRTRELRPQKALGPPPTNVVQWPQRSTTARLTVAAPLLCRRTVNDVLAEVPGRLTVNVPVRPVWPPMSTRAFFVWLISIDCSVLFWPVAKTLTRRPPPDGVVVTWT